MLNSLHDDALLRIRTLLPFLLVILLTLPALQPLWQPGLQQTDDGAHHLFRLFNLDLAQRSGHLGTRWLADEGFGYGFPTLNFYAPLGYYLGLIFHALGAGLASSLEWTLAAGLLLAGLAMVALVAELFNPWAGVLAAVVYTWAPYHLADAWTRGALGEHLAFIWLPLLLLALRRTADSNARDRSLAVGWGGLCLAGLILTHNLTLILAAPLLLGWGLLLLARTPHGAAARVAVAARMGALVALGVLLSAAFWLPAVTEVKDVLAGQVTLDFDAWAAAELAPAGQLLELRWDHLYTLVQQPPVLHALPLAQAAVMLAGLGAGVWRWRRLPHHQRRLLALSAALALFALFMQSTWSRPLWHGLPGLLLLQFAWRWQTLGVLSSALLAAFLLPDGPVPAGRDLRPLVRRVLVILTVLALLLPAALTHLPWEPAVVPTTDTPLTDANVNRATLALYDFGRGLWLREHGNVWMFEYMPVWALPRRSDFFISAGPTADPSPALTAVQVTPGPQTPLIHVYQVSSPAAWTLQMHQFYFPGWQAFVDGQPAPVQPVGPLALAGVAVPAGQHSVIMRFGLTPARRMGWIITVSGLALLGLCLLRWRPGPRRAWESLAVLLAAGLLASALLLPRGTQPAGGAPAPVQAQFGDEIALIGFDAPPARLKPGADATVTLTWLALRRPATDYKVFVHLVDSQGVVWAQHDGEPGFFFSPTTRWQAGEIVDDYHPLTFVAAPPAGRYQLRVGLYDGASGQRLSVNGPNGTAVGDEVVLAEVEWGR